MISLLLFNNINSYYYNKNKIYLYSKNILKYNNIRSFHSNKKYEIYKNNKNIKNIENNNNNVENNDNIIYILDGTAMLYRSYYGMESKKKFIQMKTSNEYGNIACSALVGLSTTFARFIREFKPKYIAAAFDSGKTFRNDLFPDYKQQREKVILFLFFISSFIYFRFLIYLFTYNLN